MKAVLRTRYGYPDVLNLGDIPVSVPKFNELLIKVYATTVNRTDCGILRGKPAIIQAFTGFGKPKHQTPGTDFAGVIEEVGTGVTAFKRGDKVWGFDDNGLASQAEFMVIREDRAIFPVPEGFSFTQAAACAEGAHYAVNFINKVSLFMDHKVMVNGGTGAIGSAAIQLLKAKGLKVTATAPTDHLTTVKTLGADRVIDYQNEDFTKDHEVYDFVFDAVGKSSFSQCKPLLKSNGTYISSELGPHSENPLLALISPFTSGKKVKFPLPTNIKGSLAVVLDLMKQGKFKPLIDRSFRLEEIRKAYTYVLSEQKIGNVILQVRDEK
ncbi:NAD(P)-dependent alcohol dehydrogenase [Saccharicrinis sp. FJH62]|uniref:NAD(P)-dependent alcohol dehydrogenase n=1 Tax=Saccharicrinis sp. FJH62 TaxID=3344657 RepID=UPI0035D5136C